jgi:hypothetical protein
MHDEDQIQRLELLEASMRIGLTTTQRVELEGDPSRAVAIIEFAEQQHALRSIAGFTVARYRAGFDPRSAPSKSSVTALPRRREPEPVEQAPSLSAIEYAWSFERSPLLESVLGMMCTAIGRTGGFEAVLRDGWWTRERFDGEGELVAVACDCGPGDCGHNLVGS